MIVVKVELHSAITGKVETLSSVVISNDGKGSKKLGNYEVLQFRKSVDPSDPKSHWWKRKPVRKGRVKNHPRLSQPVLKLVSKALRSIGHE